MKRELAFYEMRWPKARQSRLRSILAMLERSVDWPSCVQLVEPHYPRPGNGRQPVPLDSMLRIHVIAWLMSANDRKTEDLLIDSVSVCAFCQIDETGPRPPDAETIGNFRRRLERSGLQDIIHSHLMAELTKKGVSLMPGGIVEPRWIGPLL